MNMNPIQWPAEVTCALHERILICLKAGAVRILVGDAKISIDDLNSLDCAGPAWGSIAERTHTRDARDGVSRFSQGRRPASSAISWQIRTNRFRMSRRSLGNSSTRPLSVVSSSLMRPSRSANCWATSTW